MQRLNVIVSSFACSPLRGSEFCIGWNIVTCLSKYHDISVLYGEFDSAKRLEVDNWLRSKGPIPGLFFYFIQPSLLSHLLKRVNDILKLQSLYQFNYRLWQKTAFKKARCLHQEKPFDIAHQLTINTYRSPGYLLNLNIPFVWGPISGAVDEPWSFILNLNTVSMIKVGIRKILNQIQMHVSPLPQKAARYATHIWTSTNVDYEMVTRIWKRPASLMTDTGTFFDPTRHCVNRNPDKPFRLVWSGRHISRKELPIVLHALSAIGKNIQLTILGEGIETNRWKLLAKSLKLEDKIQWLGWLPRNEALSKMEEAHAFVFSSIREAASTVIMEALSLGLPVICHDACGMAIAINDTCGIKIPLHSPTESIKGFAAAITRLRDEPGLLSKLSKGALKRASELTWDSKAEEIARTYHGIVV